MRKLSLEGGQMEKNLPSHQIDHYNLSSAQCRSGLLACGGATALPVDQHVQRRGTLEQDWEEDAQHKPGLSHLAEGRGKEMGGSDTES